MMISYSKIETLNIDIETYSSEDLDKVGVYKYVDSPDFKILLFAYSVNENEVQVVDLAHGEEIPEDVFKALIDPEVKKYAFNAQFERVCLNKFFNIETVNWNCTMAKAWYCGITGSLASVGNAIGLSEEESKMKIGKKLIDKFCKPNKNKQLDLLDEDWKLFKEYNKRDVEVELAIKQKLDRFEIPEWELELWALDQKINDRGIRLDIDMINNAIKIDQEIYKAAAKRFKEITGCDNPNSLKDIREFIEIVTGVPVKSLAKGVIDDLIVKFKDYPEVVEVLQIRQQLSKTSTAKYYTMKETIMSDGRSRGNIQYYGASRTGRWAGKLIQVHNLPRNYIKDLDTARRLIKSGDYEMLSMAYDNVSDILSQCLRTVIIPSKGKKFIVSDFSAIEARVVAWFANEQWVLDVFKDTGLIYEATASKMFNVPIEQVDKELRSKGKVATLALGYQGSVGALKAMGADKMGLNDDELADLVTRWRETNQNIVNLWYETETRVKKTIRENSVEVWADGKLKSYIRSGILFIELPSGRCLSYARPYLRPHDKFEGKEQIIFHERNSAGTGWIVQSTYGGKLVENIVQATARDILAFSLLKLDQAGYDIVMHVHDEVIIEIEKDRYELKKVIEIMSAEVEWARDLPLNAEGFECEYYQKD